MQSKSELKRINTQSASQKSKSKYVIEYGVVTDYTKWYIFAPYIEMYPFDKILGIKLLVWDFYVEIHN